MRSPHCWVSVAFPPPLQVSPHSCSIACPRTVPLGRDDPCGAGNLGVPHKEMCAAAEGLGTASRACRAGGRWGVREGCIPVVDTQLLPCSSPAGLLDFHGQRTPPFPLRVLLGCIPWVHGCSRWHCYLPLKCLFYWAFPLLKVIPKRPLSKEAPVNKRVSEGTGGLVFTLELLFPHPPPKLRHVMCPKPCCHMGLWS